MKTIIRLGDVAKDKITGFVGVVKSISEYLIGTEQVCLQPEELKDGKPVEAEWFETPQIVIVAEQKLPSPNFNPKFELGQEVKDMISGLKCRVNSRSYWLHGCVRYGLLPFGLDKNGKPYPALGQDEVYIEACGNNKITGRNTGGPMTDKPTSV